ncbi:uncharacterized protein ARMOST_08603 [Armillaria ostoyae]|uniref:peptide-methionine (S)-S-oxide reductase n=1 Tax=Armillaria ostoyae TaxID=47428 RepID=A0A284R933_ARMOS|nr:uncharacterized protein ARMOST_08603 [Armillaria ostoyae]
MTKLSPARSTPVELPFLKHYPEGKGVININVRYTNGKADATSTDYKIICTTDHAEAVNIEFDPAVVGYDKLVEFFYHTHDPMTLNSQGKDTGTCMSLILYLLCLLISQ